MLHGCHCEFVAVKIRCIDFNASFVSSWMRFSEVRALFTFSLWRFAWCIVCVCVSLTISDSTSSIHKGSKEAHIIYKKYTNNFDFSFVQIELKMSRGNFRGNRNNQNRQYRNDKKVDLLQGMDDSNPVVISFRGYADELNDKHDRYERIVKFSRDITIESKRLIFLLHTVDKRKPNSAKILSDAFTRLTNLCANSFASIAKELANSDPYQYARAYSAGLQEFVEAFTYYDYLCNDRITNWTDLQKKLTYTVKQNGAPESGSGGDSGGGDGDCDVKEKEKPTDATEKEIKCLVQPLEFMLGLADTSGEIMRKCINSLGSGDIETCTTACNFIQHLYSG